MTCQAGGVAIEGEWISCVCVLLAHIKIIRGNRTSSQGGVQKYRADLYADKGARILGVTVGVLYAYIYLY